MIPWSEKEEDTENKNNNYSSRKHVIDTVILEEDGYAQSRYKITQKYQAT